MDGQRDILVSLPLEKGTGTHITGGWVALRPIWFGAENLTLPVFDRQAVLSAASRLTD